MSSLFNNGALLPVGKQGEEAAYRFLNSMSNVTHVEDVRDIEAWQKQDVDYRITLQDKSVKRVEVKTDTRIEQTGNVLFELTRIHHTATTCAYVGWSVFSQADFMLIYAPDTRAFRLFRFMDFRRVMQAYTRQKRDKTRVVWITSDDTRSTLNLLIPLVAVPHQHYVARGDGWQLKGG